MKGLTVEGRRFQLSGNPFRCFTPVRMAVSRGQRQQKKCQETQRNYFFASLAFLHPLLLCGKLFSVSRPSEWQSAGRAKTAKKVSRDAKELFFVEEFLISAGLSTGG